MFKARSRLAEHPSSSLPTTTRFIKVLPFLFKTVRKLLSLVSLPWSGYFHHLPTLGLSVLTAILLWQLASTVPPAHIQNFLFPNSYLPFTGLFFATSFFGSSFIFLNSRRGLVIASCLTWLVFFRLNQVELSMDILGYILLFFGILEIVFSCFEWLAPQLGKILHANFKQTPTTQNRPKPEGTTSYTPRRPRSTHRR